MNSAILLLHGDPPEAEFLLRLRRVHPFLLACDGAANQLVALEIAPDAILGDFDSLNAEAKQSFAQVPLLARPNQDQTDGEKGLIYLKEQGFKEVVLLGALGGRLDHLLYHLAFLARPAYRGMRILLEEQCQWGQVIEGVQEVDSYPGQVVSLLPLYGLTRVTSKGLKYELRQQNLALTDLCSVSNQALGEKFTLRISLAPCLLIVQR